MFSRHVFRLIVLMATVVAKKGEKICLEIKMKSAPVVTLND